MRDPERHPEPTAPDLGLLCLRAVMIDNRIDDRVRMQAQQLLVLAEASAEHDQPAQPGPWISTH